MDYPSRWTLIDLFPSIATSIPQSQVLRIVVNQEIELNDDGWRGTALHCAVKENSVEAARILLESGAVIDKPDSRGLTALMMTKTQDMVTMLVRHGASLVHHFSGHILDFLNMDPLFSSLVYAYSDPNTWYNSPETIPKFLRTICDTRGRIDCETVTMRPPHLVHILEAGIKLDQELGSGMSLVHLALVDEASSTFVLNSNLSLELTLPFPWHLEFFTNPIFMTSKWRHFRAKLREEDFVRIAHLQPSRGFSPMCGATVQNEIEMIRNCLSLGADVDFEGSPHGSAVILASACGNVEAVRVLVRAGASLSYEGQNGHRNVFTFCRSRAVRRWLLVERFTEQQRVEVGSHWGDGEKVRPWAGTAVARLKLVGNRAMCYHETLMDYAEKLAKLRIEWRGKVIPPICLDGIIYRS